MVDHPRVLVTCKKWEKMGILVGQVGVGRPFLTPGVPNKQGSLKRGVGGSPARAIRPPGVLPAKLARLSQLPKSLISF
jgi:hypothetical protein